MKSIFCCRSKSGRLLLIFNKREPLCFTSGSRRIKWFWHNKKSFSNNNLFKLKIKFSR